MNKGRSTKKSQGCEEKEAKNKTGSSQIFLPFPRFLLRNLLAFGTLSDWTAKHFLRNAVSLVQRAFIMKMDS